MKQQFENILLNWSITNDLTNNYILCTLPEKEIEHYQVKMIQKWQPNKFLKIKHLNEKNEHSLFYDITGYINLFDYVYQNGINYKFLMLFVNKVISVFMEGKEYLLSDKGFLLEGDKIFVNPHAGSIRFIYLPCKNILWDNRLQFEYLVKELMPYIHKQDEMAIALAHQLRMLLEDKQCNIQEIAKILRHNQPKVNIHGSDHPKQIDTPIIEAIELDETPNKTKRKDSMMTFIILQVFIVTIIFLCGRQWIGMEAQHSNRLMKVISLIGIIGISEFMILLKVLVHKGKRDKNITSSHGLFYKLQRDDRIKRPKWHWDEPPDTVKVSERLDKDTRRVYLIDNRDVHIPILKSPFILGKIKSIADHSIQNELVSRVHCQITNEEEDYYIIDLDSTNGTLLNNERLIGHKKYSLQDGDKIRITNEYFTFRHL